MQEHVTLLQPEAPELSRRLADLEGAPRWNTAAARAWWDAYLPAGPGVPA